MDSVNDPLRKLRAVSIGAAAEALTISKRTLQRLIASGKFPAPIKIGAASRVLIADLERYVERQRRQEKH